LGHRSKKLFNVEEKNEMNKKFFAVLGILALLVALLPATTVGADKPIRDASPRHDSPNYNNGQALKIEQAEKIKGQLPLGPAKVGSVKTWLGLDDYRGVVSLKNYTLRGVGNHVEVWVANNLNFPNISMLNPLTTDPTDFFPYNDCRNDGVRNVVTDEQVEYLIDQFDNNMYPIESDWWSVPPQRDGHKALLPTLIPNLPSSEYKGEGDNIVVLVDNVRDDNFYDPNNANTYSYIAGFFYSLFDDYFNRTVMSIDAWDWVHRTTEDPPHQPTTDPCTSAPARPNLYEGVFAHEYQHLLHHYTDPDEPNWVNEGLSDFTEVITGYAHLDRHVDEKGYESHTQSFLGWLSVFHPDWNPLPYDSGPENGLTAWGDQGDDEILADYGAAMFFMNLVNSQGWDRDFFHAWQHNPANGIAGLNATLADFGSTKTFADLFGDMKISALVDGYLDNGASVIGGTAADFQNEATEATVNFTSEANGEPGAPPWGSDYIDLGSGAALTSVTFDGDDEFVFPGGPDWVVDNDGYFTNPDVDDGVYDNNQDLSIARSVAGHDGEVLSFDHYYAMELGWDFGFVQVSTDDGATWESLACTGTTSAHDPGALSHIVANVPGYNGSAGTAASPVGATCPALPVGSDYIAFRLMTDPAVQEDGWHVRNIKLNGADLGMPGDLTGWDNQKFFSPVSLAFEFVVVGINGTVDGFGNVTAGTSVHVIRPTLGAGNESTLSADDLAALSSYGKVVAIVSGIPASEESTLYQPYSLLVNEMESADGQ
jgi:hypothetical protein